MTMRLYATPIAPNAMRVQIFMLEKGISAEVVDVSALPAGEFSRVNPFGQVPALELDDGEVITESLTICQYLDAVSGPPFLFGSTPAERARIGMWERRAELLLFIPSIEYGHHVHPMFAELITQQPEWAMTLVPKALRMVDAMADQLDRHAYLTGDEISAADFTAALGYFGLIAFGALAPSAHLSVQRWAQAMMVRASMAPLLQAAEFLKNATAAEPQIVAEAEGTR